MKYIEAERITAEIDKIIDGLKRNCNPDPLGTTEECWQMPRLRRWNW